jgi:selenocysteine-specific elongation factor
MQMFHKPVKVAKQGDRVGICVTNLDPNLIERGVATSSPSPMILSSTLICLVRKVRFFRQQCKSNSLFHISIGHLTVTATVFFFGAKELSHVSNTESKEGEPKDSSGGFRQTSFPSLEFDWGSDYEYQEELISGKFALRFLYHFNRRIL